MAFTTEEDVRVRFQLNDTVQVPASLVNDCIEDAHAQILRVLDPQYDVVSPEGALVLAETMLAGAAVFRALASKEAFDQKRVALGSQRIEDGGRFRSLMAVAAAATDQGWGHLEPYLLDRPALAPADASDTQPILGEE